MVDSCKSSTNGVEVINKTVDTLRKMQVALSPYGKSGAYAKFFGMTDEEIMAERRKELGV